VAGAGIIFWGSERTNPMMKTPRLRQIARLIAAHVAADPATKWVVHMHSADLNDWAVWLLRPGYPLFEYDHYVSRC
jgi:hypothetical protein